jgi:hypothetical protein
MRNQIVLAAVMAAGLAVGATAATVPPPSQTVASYRIVIYKGDNQGYDGPATVNSVTYETDAEPRTIVTNKGDIVDDPSYDKSIGACPKDCGIWWVKTGPNSVGLHVFFWEPKDGAKTQEESLSNMFNNNGWFTLKNGDLTPRCLLFGQLAFQLSKPGGVWDETSKPCETAPVG